MLKKVYKIIALLIALVFIVSVAQPAYTSNEGKMRVWVEFRPGQAANVEKSLNAIGAEFHYRFDHLNSFVVTVPETALTGLRNNPNVLTVEEDAIRYAYGQEVPYGIDMVQARDVWDANRDDVIDPGAPTGANRTVCIIDSGLWTAHEDFAGVNILGGYPSGWDTDKCGHGTHVAGTIAAQMNSVGVVGVTPGGTNLYIVKVFGDNCSWTYSSTLADAANRCEAAGADVISMSLGGTNKNVIEERAFNTLYNNGILSVAAAGNDGNTAISYPGGYASVMSVAAIDKNMLVATFSQQNSTVEIAAPGVDVLSTVPFINKAEITVDGVTYNGNQIENAKFGTATGNLIDGGLCNATGGWAGKVVLCERGVISFYDKVMNVQNSGGVAAVIYNNAPGDFLGTLGEGYTSNIPAISLSQEDGQSLVANKLGISATVTTSSTIPASGYEAWDGTSMATPHVSGVAALVWSANPEWTNAQIREALTASALDLGAAGRDNAYGYGLVQAKAALDYLAGGDPPPPPPPSGTMVLTVTTFKTVYAINDTVEITVTANDSSTNSAINGANVNVVVKNARGKTVASLNGTTNTEGQVLLSFQLKVNMGKGEYKVSAIANKEGYSEATGTTTFTVQ
ncbi:MAG: peptidase S8 [Chloroflexi bacterium HGW-Chloroflexi-3]|nr:MAG: peptidase S8 [Chloroflexi bacterium HGW-Chloroflexi-3]